MSGLDFADPERGISFSSRPGGPTVLFDHDRVVASGSADEVSLDLDVSELGRPLRFAGPSGAPQELALVRVTGTVSSGDDEFEVACLGLRTGDEATLPEGAELGRSIAVALSDGGLLALSALREIGAGQDGESIAAALADADGEPSAPEEVLLSTEYDDQGRQRRATLELWPPPDGGERPLRGAGRIVCGTTLSRDGNRLDVAFFRWSINGRAGLGRYELIRRA